MKKTFTKIMLLLFALVVGIGNVWALDETVTFPKTTSGSTSYANTGISITGTNVSVSINKGTNQNLNVNTDGTRVYPGNTIQFTASNNKKIASIVFSYKINVSSSTSPTGVNANNGSFTTGFTTATSATDNQTATWSAGNSTTISSVTFTVTGSKGNYALHTALVTYVDDGGTPLTPVSISLSGDYPTTFFVGDAFSHQGMVVTATFDDESTSNVTSSATFTGYNMSQTGNQTVTVSYTSNEVEVTTTYAITVNAIPNKTITEFISAGGGKCYLTGTVSNIDNTIYGNFNLTDNTGTIYVYGCLTSTGQSGQFSTLNIVANDIIKVLANTYQYYNNTTHEAVNVVFVEEIVPNAQTLTVSATNGSVEITGKTLVNNSCEVTEGASVTATATPADHYTFSSWSATGVTLANDTDNPLTFTMPTNDVTLTANFTEDAKYTATFHVLNNSSYATVYEGSAITFPSVTAPNGYTFMGWTTSAIDGIQDDAPATLVSSTNMGNANVDYYAVFAIQSVSSTPATLTTSEIQANFSKTALAYNDNPKSYDDTDDDITWTLQGFTTTNVPWIQLRKNNVVAYLKINASSNISNIRFTITNATVETGQSTSDINYHGEYAGYIILLSSATANATQQTEGILGYTNSVSNNIASVSPTSSVSEVYVQVTSGARIWGVEVTCVSYSNYCTNVTALSGDLSTAITESGNAYYISAAANVPANTAVTINGVLGNADASLLTINNGGQLYTESAVNATVQKSITGYTDDNTGWNFIASPIDGSISPSTVTNLLGEQTSNNPVTYNYDLYRLNPAEPDNKGWENYHQHNENADPFMLVNGQGYLYAKSSTTTLEFAGTIKPFDGSANTVSLAEGWNLVGNPYTFNVFSSKSYYTITTVDGKNKVTPVEGSSSAITPCTGIVVKSADASNVAFMETAGEWATGNKGNIQMTLAQTVATRGGRNAETIDNAIVSFNEGTELEKFYFGNQSANIYIPQNQEEYAIVSANAQGEMPVNFVAAEDGEYTITVNPEEVEMSYLHLIDNKTGNDVDLLVNPSYTFNAKTTDYASRFRLVFSANYVNQNDNENENFAFIGSDGQLIISGTGTIQIIDMMGRVISTRSTEERISTNGMTPGVYVLQLITGSETKTQKIVIR